MKQGRNTLSLLIATLLQALCVSGQCGDTPMVIHVPVYTTTSIASPGYPDIYAINLNCSWIFELDDVEDYFFVRMDNVYVDCFGDRIRLINLHKNTEIVSFCDDAITSDIYTDSGRLQVKFITDGKQRDNDKGFRIYVTSMPRVKQDPDVASCPAEGDVELVAETNPKGLTSPNFPKKYPSNKICYWKIPSIPGYKTMITVDFIDIESLSPTSPVDFLQIYYTDDDSTSQNKRYSGRWNFQRVHDNLITSMGTVRLTFTTDIDTSFSGFLLHYQLVALPFSGTTVDSTLSSLYGKVITSDTPVTTSATLDTPVTSDNTVVTSEDTTVTSEDTTITSEDQAVTSDITAVTSEDTTVTSESTTITSEDTTITSGDTHFTSENTPVTSDDTTITSEFTTVTSDDTSVTSEDTLVTSEDIAVTSEYTIVTSEYTIITSEDTPVTSEETKEDISSTSKEATITTDNPLLSTESPLPTSKNLTTTTKDVISTLVTSFTEIISTSEHNTFTTDKTVSTSGSTTNYDTKRQTPKFVHSARAELRTSSCDVQTCVIPLVAAIGLLLSILFVVIVALGVRRSHRRDRYHVRMASLSRPVVKESANGDFDL